MAPPQTFTSYSVTAQRDERKCQQADWERKEARQNRKQEREGRKCERVDEDKGWKEEEEQPCGSGL